MKPNQKGVLSVSGLFVLALIALATSHVRAQPATQGYWENEIGDIDHHGEHGGQVILHEWRYTPRQDETWKFGLTANQVSDSGTSDVAWWIYVAENVFESSIDQVVVNTIKQPSGLNIEGTKALKDGTEYIVRWGYTGEKVRDNYNYYVRGRKLKVSAQRLSP